MCQQALLQVVRKPWTPEEELLDFHLSFLIILFIAPSYPIGVITTLVSRIVWGPFDLMKMLVATRCTFPYEAIAQSFRTFSFIAIVLSIPWTVLWYSCDASHA